VFQSRHLSKIQNGRHKQRVGQHTLARQKLKKNTKNITVALQEIKLRTYKRRVEKNKEFEKNKRFSLEERRLSSILDMLYGTFFTLETADFHVHSIKRPESVQNPN
jgi:hypothetical protein